jgi:hypothetical protein
MDFYVAPAESRLYSYDFLQRKQILNTVLESVFGTGLIGTTVQKKRFKSWHEVGYNIFLHEKKADTGRELWITRKSFIH